MSSVVVPVESFESLVTERVIAIGAPADGGTVDVWQYLAEGIDEFAVAKSIVDHFDAHPKDLQDPGVDRLGLYLRAKVTLKREQVSFAIAQRTVDKAREQSRSVVGIAKSFLGFANSVRSAVLVNPGPVVLTAVLIVLLWVR